MRRLLAASAVGFGLVLVGAAPSFGATAAGGAAPWSQARGFLGPIGWYWNNLYYRVFDGATANMALFGSVLFVTPLIAVVALRIVLSGTRGVFQKPVVPESVRTRLN